LTGRSARDAKKIRVENQALNGWSSRTFRTQGYWDKMLTNSKPGDFVFYKWAAMAGRDPIPLKALTQFGGNVS
jgi:hypothetical protein